MTPEDTGRESHESPRPAEPSPPAGSSRPDPGEAVTDEATGDEATGGEAVPGEAAGGGSTARGGPAAEKVSGDELAHRLAQAEEKAAENWERFLRARADLENYRRRVQRDLHSMVRRGKKELVLRLLDVVDSLERAAAWENGSGTPDGARQAGAGGAGDAARQGMVLIHRQLLKVLADEGVAPMEAVGRPFDPALHEAVATAATDEVPAGTVTAELQKGYTYEGEVLRPARVLVSQPTGNPVES